MTPEEEAYLSPFVHGLLDAGSTVYRALNAHSPNGVCATVAQVALLLEVMGVLDGKAEPTDAPLAVLCVEADACAHCLYALGKVQRTLLRPDGRYLIWISYPDDLLLTIWGYAMAEHASVLSPPLVMDAVAELGPTIQASLCDPVKRPSVHAITEAAFRRFSN